MSTTILKEKLLQEHIASQLEKLNWKKLGKKKQGIIQEDIFFSQLEKLNPEIDFASEIRKSILGKIVLNGDYLFDLPAINKKFHNWLLNDLYLEDKDITIKLLDKKIISNNSFHMDTEFSVLPKRADLVLFVNGLPFVVIECKSPFRGSNESRLEKLFNQVQTYQEEVPSLFTFNLFNVITNGHKTKYGTVSAKNLKEYWYWRNLENVSNNGIDWALITLLSPRAIFDFLENFIFFAGEEKVIKKVATCHQYFASLAFRKVLFTKEKRKGIIEHTQGSGKSSYLVIFLVKQILNFSPSATVLIINDRKELDKQIQEKFSLAKDNFLTRIEFLQTKSRSWLKKTLQEIKQGSIIFYNIHKMEKNISEVWNSRDDIYIIVDEAHRSWSGEKPRLSIKEEQLEERYGFAKWIFTALPEAKRLGITATPIESKEISTSEVFGSTIHKYTEELSLEDEMTVEIIYYDEFIHLTSSEPIDWENIKETTLKKIITHETRLQEIVRKTYQHFQRMVKEEKIVSEKALFVAFDRRTACRIWDFFHQDFIGDEKNELKGKVKINVISSNEDENWMRKIIGSEEEKEKWVEEFKNKDDPSCKIMIVVDRLTTGIDIPHLSLLYIDKRIGQFHTLNQTIKRVNRSYPGKSVGIVVDFIGLATNLRQISTLISRRNIGKLAQQELEELEKELPNIDKNKEFIEIKSLTGKIIQNLSLRYLLKNKVRKFINFLHHGQEQLNQEQKVKIKNYILLENNIRNAEEATEEIKWKGNTSLLEEKQLSLELLIVPQTKINFGQKIDHLLAQAKKVYDTKSYLVFLSSLLEKKKSSFKEVGIKLNKQLEAEINRLVEYNDYESLINSLTRIIKSADDLWNKGEVYNDWESYGYYDILTSLDLPIRNKEKVLDNLAKKISNKTKEEREKNPDWLEKENYSQASSFRNFLRELLLPYFPEQETREQIVTDIWQQNKFFNFQTKTKPENFEYSYHG